MANSAVRFETSGDRAGALWPAHLVACPRCDARVMFYRNPIPEIDTCGFERCSFACKECEAWLVGMIDPFDDTLLLSALPG
jgi:hypothetical protein